MKPGFTYRDKAKHGKRNTFPQLYEAGLISIIAPCYNEAENIEHFLSAISEIHLQPYRIEVILVNDGSRDIAILKNEWYEKNYHPEAMTWHPP